MDCEIKGVICSVIFEREDTGFKICDLDCDGKIVTVKGILPYVHPGVTIKATGRWQENSDYGLQFIVDSYEPFMPENLEDVVSFLQSGLFKRIGEITAIAIVDRFGDRTLEVLKNHPEELSKVKGLAKKAEEISETYNRYIDVYELFTFLSKFNIKMSAATQIYEKYKKEGKDPIQAVSDDPYLLSEEIPLVSFSDADRIASSLGFPYNSSKRICAGMLWILKGYTDEGHVFYPLEEILNETCGRLGVTYGEAEECISLLENENKIVTDTIDPYGRCVYIKRMYDYEHFIKKKFDSLSEDEFTFDERTFGNVIRSFEEDEHLKMGEMQKFAVETAAKRGFLVLTGGPGTGKTTIIKAITRYFDMIGLKTVLTAPTGRAAKRITESCGKEAKTIHRLLEVKFDPDDAERTNKELKFKKNENDPLDADVIIADEASMIDIILMNHLLKAMKYGARMILVGDKDQLPSVGPGKILADLISDDKYPKVVLDEIYRQASESLIAVNAYKINHGEMPVLNDREKDFFFISCRNADECAEKVIALCTKRLPKAYGYDPLKDIQVITPTKKRKCGTENLNKMLQNELNGKDFLKDEKEFGGKLFRVGDRVMHTKNNYEMEWEKVGDPLSSGVGVFNGEMGVVDSVDRKKNTVTVVFDDDRFAIYDNNTLGELEHCYAITVHKSQGSEFDCCVIPLIGVPPLLISRNILYTAITRAKKFVVIVGSKETMMKMIANNRVQFRFTGMGRKELPNDELMFDDITDGGIVQYDF